MSCGLSTGQLIDGRYRVDRSLGRGGSSCVWRVYREGLNKPWALKILSAPTNRQSDSYRRFMDGAQATIDHPNVVRVVDWGELCMAAPDLTQPYIIMEHLEGETLRAALEGGGLGLSEACGILVHVVSGVGAAHAQGIVHRDLKPENVFVRRAPGGTDVKVLDFGIAKNFSQIAPTIRTVADSTVWQVTTRRGTCGYAAPEQEAGALLDHRADVWSLGILLYECLMGARPFTSQDWDNYFAACVNGLGDAERRALVSAQQPSDIVDLIDSMLAPDPSERPELETVKETLERHTAARGLPFRRPFTQMAAGVDAEARTPETWMETAVSEASSPAPSAGRASRSFRQARRFVFAMLTATCTALLMALALRGSKPEPAEPPTPESAPGPRSGVLEVEISFPDLDHEQGLSEGIDTLDVCLDDSKWCGKVDVDFGHGTVRSCNTYDSANVTTSAIKKNCDVGDIGKTIAFTIKVESIVPESRVHADWASTLAHKRPRFRTEVRPQKGAR